MVVVGEGLGWVGVLFFAGVSFLLGEGQVQKVHEGVWIRDLGD